MVPGTLVPWYLGTWYLDSRYLGPWYLGPGYLDSRYLDSRYLGLEEAWGGGDGGTVQGEVPYQPFKISSKNPSRQSLVRELTIFEKCPTTTNYTVAE